ncbi:Retrovirus-related Pol polyprotein from transposon 297 [Frankliniella fusca]|uniref:RNA-directed DNA polymerase n=1 Tax=Frankliniella fusca TaxID=407009 RepID=A0AAE1H7U5_9NEOP|nr:Retrovirus-related Pol polyprotein from transposon 297 [Frankliniella fusca]
MPSGDWADIRLREEALLGLDFFLAYGASINCDILALEFPEFSTPLIPVSSTSSCVRALFPARPTRSRPDDTPASVSPVPRQRTGEASLTDLIHGKGEGAQPGGPSSAALKYTGRPGEQGAAPQDSGRAADAAAGDSVRVECGKAGVPQLECSFRIERGEFPVLVADKVTLPPNARTAVWVRPHKKGSGSSGLYVVEPGTESRPGLHVAFCLVSVKKGEPFRVILCNLTNEPLLVARNTLLGYLVRAAVADTPPPGAFPIKKVCAPRAVDNRKTPGLDLHSGPVSPSPAGRVPAGDGRGSGPRPARDSSAAGIEGAGPWQCQGSSGAAPHQPGLHPEGRSSPERGGSPSRVGNPEDSAATRAACAPGDRPAGRPADGAGQGGGDPFATPPPSPAELLAKAKLDHLSGPTRKAIEEIITEFADCFSLGSERVGTFPILTHKIPTEPGVIIRKASYKIPYAHRQTFQEEIERLLRLGIIVRSESEWSNPILFLVKELPDGKRKVRACLDARALNEVTLPSVNYQTRTMGETLDFLSGKLYLSKADVVSAFHTIPLAEEDAEKTAFVGLHGQKYHYVRGCFGLRDLPFTFQMAIDMALAGLPDAIAYFDDLVTQDHSALLTRMLAKTIPYNITLQYLPGKTMPSDCLSRMPESVQSSALADPETLAATPRTVTRTVVPTGSLPSMDLLRPPPPTPSESGPHRQGPPGPAPVRSLLPPALINREMVQAAQAADAECQRLMGNIKLYPELAIIDGVLVSRERPRRQRRARKNRPFVPIALRSAVVRQYHQVGHLSTRKTLAAVESKWAFPFMHRTIQREIKACPECAARNTSYYDVNAPLREVPICSRPMEGLECDLVGPVPKSSKQHDHILSIKCQFSKYVIFVPLRSTDTATICRKLEKHVFSRWGIPAWLKTDNGRNLCSAEMRAYLDNLNIKKIEVLPYSPHANSVEASHKTLGNILSKLVAENKRTWHTKLPRVMMSMNSAVHDSHKHQPHQVLTGHEFRYPFPEVVEEKQKEVSPTTYAEALKTKVHQIHCDVRRQLQASSRARIEASNKNRLWREFQIHDLVLYKDPRLPAGKLTHERWRARRKIN